MKTLRDSIRAAVLAAAFALSTVALFGGWEEKTAGNPVVERLAIKEYRIDQSTWIVLQDKLGRLFAGGDQLHVFEGQSWRSFPVPSTYALHALAFGDDGRLWVGAINEIGYFDETSPGEFMYHSLLSHLPEENRLIGNVWGCAKVGRCVYYICEDKLLRWDGKTLKITPYPGKARLFPLSLAGNSWFQHLESGLFRLTESGPQLEIPAADIPNTSIFGLAEDNDGLLLATSTGFYRPGKPPHQVFSERLNQFIAHARLTCFSSLPGGSYILGSLNGGIVLVNKAGDIQRIWDTSSGIPTQEIYGITSESSGYVWCASRKGIFGFDTTDRVTLFNEHNGLRGNAADFMNCSGPNFYAVNSEGVFKMEMSNIGRAQFTQIPQLTRSYYHLLPFRSGLLLSRHGGVDYFCGTKVQTAADTPTATVYFAQPSRADPNTVYLVEPFAVERMVAREDGSFSVTRVTTMSDPCVSIKEDSVGRLWLGTVNRGAYSYDFRTNLLSHAIDPSTGQRLLGIVRIVANDRRLIFLCDGQLLQAQVDGSDLRPLLGAPAFRPIAARVAPNHADILVAYRNRTPANSTAQGLGILSIDDTERANWRELEVPQLETIGSIHELEFSEESGRQICWIGGAEGVLRLDYESIPTIGSPVTPIVRLHEANSGFILNTPRPAFRLENHNVRVSVFTGDYSRGRNWLIQTRLGTGGGEWSAPSPRRSFEFTNLSDGNYEFEARAVNSSGMAGESARVAFSILPPWYRTPWAYGGYTAGLVLALFGFIRIRERRIRGRNQELKELVDVRTAELVKASAAKDDFIAGISHEIRNPMNGVVGIAETLKIDGLDPESRRKFGLLRQCASHLSSLLEEILDFSKIEAGTLELENKTFDLAELVDSITAITASDSEKYAIPVEITTSPAIPQQLTGDPRRVRQILVNLVGNAIKFSGRGRVRVTASCRALEPTRTEVTFSVADDGPGIAPEDQKKLFVRFERGTDARQGRVPGTGLGLALCKGLAEKMGGRIWLESAPGAGSCFYFSAPFACVEPEIRSGPRAVHETNGNFKTALVVDDEEHNRIVLTDMLETLGFEVRAASDGPQALALGSTETFHVVFLDYDLPGLSGLEISRRIRALSNETAKSMVVATTAYNTPEKRAQCIAAGMNAFIGKPITLERLRQTLAGALPPSIPPGPAGSSAPGDPLLNLRRLAARKQSGLAQELALYFSEFEAELGRLASALQSEDTIGAGRYTHLLTGRCGFIHELKLVQTLQRLEAATKTSQWAVARAFHDDLFTQMTELRVRLVSDAPAARPG